MVIIIGGVENTVQPRIWALAHFVFHSLLSIVCKIDLIMMISVAQANSDFHAP